MEMPPENPCTEAGWYAQNISEGRASGMEFYHGSMRYQTFKHFS